MLPEAIVKGLLSSNHSDVYGAVLPDAVVGQHLSKTEPKHGQICSLHPSLFTLRTHGDEVTHLFHLINSDGEILAPLVDVVHQTEGQILEQR